MFVKIANNLKKLEKDTVNLKKKMFDENSNNDPGYSLISQLFRQSGEN